MIGNIERYFEPITIERKTVTAGDWGPVEAWADHITVPGRLRHLSGKEQHSAGKDTPISTHRLYCNPADILTSDRISYKGKKYDVHAVNNVMHFDRLLQVDCELIGA